MAMVKQIAPALMGLFVLVVPGAAHADITGTIDATITLESGCIINGANAADGAGSADFGTLDFGTETTLFSQASAQVTGAGAGITVQCTAGVTPNLVFQTGLHDANASGAGNKAMQHSSTTTQYVSYNLLRDDDATVINNGDSVALSNDGSEQTIAVNGRAYGAAGLIAGTYNDIVTVVLEL
ncbi:Csu type fimbrial protein [Sphingobium sp. CR28]|uniref:Csu type fimbrial protein n=1 Tax=Sphingobium sp. CR28 TaxID=3400272 RepID=UPI003FEE56EF